MTIRRLGIVGRGAGNPDAWAGISVGLAQGFRTIGVDTVCIDATVPHLVEGVVRRVRGGDVPPGSWARTDDATRISAAVVAVRQSVTRYVDGWIILGADCGLPLTRQPLLTLEDMTVAQLAHFDAMRLSGLSTDIRSAWQQRQQRLYGRATACCVASNWARTSIVDDYGVAPSKVHVVGFGINTRIDPPLDRDWSRPRYLFIGHEWDRKNGDRVVDAFVRVRERHPDARLDVVGRHPRLDVDGVYGHGPLPLSSDRAAARALLEPATCFVLPSLTEPFGIAYLEAGAAAIPSIGTTVGGAADAIGPGGILVDPLDARALQAAMLELADPGFAERIGRLALEHSRDFTWAAVASRMLAALPAALAARAEEP